MAIFHRLLTLGAGSVILATAAHAQPEVSHCRAIADPASRLACYDQLSGLASAAPAPRAAMPAPASPPARPAAQARPAPDAAPMPASSPPGTTYATLRKRSNFDALVVNIDALPHGLFRLHLGDGTAYDTSMEGARIAQGATVHIRRSPVGTTFVDLPGQAPIPVRLVRPD